MSATKRFYEHYWTTGFSPTGHSLPPIVAALLSQYAGATMIDVGCGDAGHAGRWAEANRCKYTGYDISEAAVELSVRQGFDAELIEDAASLPLADQSVDTVLCTEVMEHLFLPLDAATEMRRVLRPGGALIVTVPNVAHWRQRADLALLGRWNPFGDNLSVSEPWRDPHLRFFTTGTLIALLKSAGFTMALMAGIPEHLLSRVPRARRFAGEPGLISRMLCRVWPTLFSTHLVAVGVRCGRI